MSINRWLGNSPATAQADTITLAGTPATGNTISVSMGLNPKSVTYTLTGSDTTATAAAALQALLSASLIPEFVDAQWSYQGTGSVIDVQANTAGMPYTFTVAATGGGITIAGANVTPSSGPNDATTATNWGLNHTPTSTDNIVLDGNDGGGAILYGLGSFTVANVNQLSSFTQQIGLPPHNTSNGGYPEYRTRFLTWSTSTVNIGVGGPTGGSGSGQMFIGLVASATCDVFMTGARASSNIPALELTSAGNPTALNIQYGDVGIDVTTETNSPTFGTITLTSSNSILYINTGVTATALLNNGGTVTQLGTTTALTQNGGSYTQVQGTLTAFAATGGTIVLLHSGTITTANAVSQGPGNSAVYVDCSQNSLTRTFTNGEFLGGSALYDPWKTVIFSNPLAFDAASLAVSDLGPTFNLAR